MIFVTLVEVSVWDKLWVPILAAVVASLLTTVFLEYAVKPRLEARKERMALVRNQVLTIATDIQNVFGTLGMIDFIFATSDFNTNILILTLDELEANLITLLKDLSSLDFLYNFHEEQLHKTVSKTRKALIAANDAKVRCYVDSSLFEAVEQLREDIGYFRLNSEGANPSYLTVIRFMRKHRERAESER